MFDGCGAAQQAFKNLNIKTKVYSSEIDPYAASVSQYRHPFQIPMGDIKEIKKVIPDVDFYIGGSPCTNLSIAGNREGLDGDKSKLFWEWLRVRDLAKPRFWILENVASMSTKSRDAITEEVGVEPILIDSALVSAQHRERLYWCNFEVKDIPHLGYVIRDIVEDLDANTIFNHLKLAGKTYAERRNRLTCLQVGTASGIKGHEHMRRLYDIDGKSPTLNTMTGGNREPKFYFGTHWRKASVLECERLQTLPDDYTKLGLLAKGKVVELSNSQRKKMLGNTFTVKVIECLIASALNIPYDTFLVKAV